MQGFYERPMKKLIQRIEKTESHFRRWILLDLADKLGTNAELDPGFSKP